MKKLLLIIGLCIILSSINVSANPIDESSDTLTSDGLSCWAQSNGRIVNTTPCTAGSPTAESEYTISTTDGKLALAFTQEVGLKVKALRTKNVLTKISSFSKYTNENIVLASPVSGSNVATATIKAPVGKCEYGRGNLSTELDVQYKNGSSFGATICYDKTDGALNFNHTIPEYISLPTFTTEEYYEELIPIRNNNYERMPVWDLRVKKAKLIVDWKDRPVFGEKRSDKFWVIGYDTDLDMELSDGLATVLDPFFNTSWTRRMTINLTCPASAVGDQRCFFNDSQIIQVDHANLVSAGLSLASGFDVRLVFRNDSPTDNDQNEIPFLNLSGFNQVNTTLMFKLQGGTNPLTDIVLTAGVVNTSYYLYFNNAGATSQNYGVSQVLNRGGMDYNQTNLMMCFDFDNETTEATVFADQAKIHNRCKTGILGSDVATEIVLNSTAAIDFEPNVDSIGRSVNIVGMSSLGKSASFNVASARCLITQDSARYNFDNFTIMSWFKENATSGTNTGSIISIGAPNIVMGLLGSSALFRCYIADGATEAFGTTTNLVVKNEWAFGACVYHNNGTITSYLSNSTFGLKKSFSIDSAANTIDDFTGGMSIGNRVPCTGTTNVFNGAIDSIFIYNASLEANEIAAIYNWTRPREGGVVTFNYGAQETAVSNTAPSIVLNTSIWPNGTSIHLNETVDVRINVTFLDADGDNGTINGTFFVNNTNTLFVAIGVPVRANQTVQFNLSNTTFGRNATIYFNSTGSDNATTKLEATMVTSANVTVRNILPPQITNLTPTASQRVRQNFTINWNQTGDLDDPMSNLGWNTTVNGTAFCGQKNATTSCLVLNRPAGQNSFNITTLDGENYTSNALVEVVVDETPPFYTNLTNFSVQNTEIAINWTINEISNFTINYSDNCANLNQIVTGSIFNLSGGTKLTGLTAGNIYCWYITFNDNITSEFGANINTSPIFNFTTTGTSQQAPQQGGGGGVVTITPPAQTTTVDPELGLNDTVDFSLIASAAGNGGGGITVLGKALSNKTICKVDITPNLVTINDRTKFVSVAIKNNEEQSYSPDIGIMNETGKLSARHRLAITNVPGQILTGSTTQVGILADSGLTSGVEPISASNQLALIDDRCATILVELDTEITGKFVIPGLGTLLNFFSDLYQKTKDFILNAGNLLSESIIGENSPLKVFMLFIVIAVGLGALIFSGTFFVNNFFDLVTKIVMLLIISPIVTTLIVIVLRNIFGG